MSASAVYSRVSRHRPTSKRNIRKRDTVVVVLFEHCPTAAAVRVCSYRFYGFFFPSPSSYSRSIPTPRRTVCTAVVYVGWWYMSVMSLDAERDTSESLTLLLPSDLPIGSKLTRFRRNCQSCHRARKPMIQFISPTNSKNQIEIHHNYVVAVCWTD